MDDIDLFAQLVEWQAAGYAPELHSVLNDQWLLKLDTDHWSRRGRIDERCPEKALQYITGAFPTPQEAIYAAMRDIK